MAKGALLDFVAGVFVLVFVFLPWLDPEAGDLSPLQQHP